MNSLFSSWQQIRYTSHTESQISWIGSCQLCLFFLLALVAGPLFDKGRFRYLVGAGSVLWTLSVFLIPEAQTYSQSMFVQGILGGLGVGLLFVPSASGSNSWIPLCKPGPNRGSFHIQLSVQSHWFEKRRSLAVGVVASGSSVGGICFPIMLNKLIANPNVGFDTAVRTGKCHLIPQAGRISLMVLRGSQSARWSPFLYSSLT